MVELRGFSSVQQSLAGGLYLEEFPRGLFWARSCSTYGSMTWMKGQSAPSASLLMTPNWEEWWIHFWLCCHSARARQDGELGGEEPDEIQ